MTVFVRMYHPLIASTSASPKRVPQQAVDDMLARGWLQFDPAAPPVDITPYLTQAAGDSRYVRDVELDGQAAALVPAATNSAITAAVQTLVDHQVATAAAGDASMTSTALRAALVSRDLPDVSVFPGGRRVGFMGASITNGSSSSGTANFYQSVVANVAGTQKIRRWGESINGGVAGETSTQIAARVQGVIGQAARMLLVGPDFGTNSAALAVTLAQFQTDVLAVVTAARNAGIPVAVCTTVPRASSAAAGVHTLLRTYNTWLTLWAARAGVPLIDTHGVLVDPTTGYLNALYNTASADGTGGAGDGTHPNDAGHLALGKAIAPVLAGLIRTEPWPVKAPLPGYGMLTNPLVATTANWSGVATGTGTVTAAAPVAGDGLPVGNWLSIAQDNTAGGATVTTQRGATLDATQWAVGDKLLFCYYAKSSAADGRGLKVQVFDQANASRGVLLDTPQTGAPGPRMDVFTVPAGVTALRLVLSASVVAGANVTHSIGAADVYNLTRAGLDAYA